MTSNFRSVAFEEWSWWWQVSNQKDRLAIAILTFSVALIATSWFYTLQKKGNLPLPPGPRGLPLVGSLPFLDSDLHSHFAKLSQKYGPIMKLQIGSKTVIVANSPFTAKEILKEHDAIFANRDVPAAASVITYGAIDMAWAPYGPTWRMLRKVCVREMMSKMSLDALYELRRSQVRKTIRYVNSKAEMTVNMGDLMFVTMLDLIMNMLWGGTLKGEERNSVGAEFRKVFEEILAIFNIPNMSDLFPILARFDLQGVERKAKRSLVWLDQIFDPIINEKLKDYAAGTEEQGKNKESNDFVQILLRLKEEGDSKVPLTLNNIKALLFDMVGGATDTTATTIEWAMAEMIQYPDIMKKVQKELEDVVGLNNVVEESHMPKLHYLNAVLKEVQRLHPVIPLLVPRRPSESCTVSGYTIPKDSQVFINTWAIHRDPSIWDNPLEFQPERFLKATNDKWDYSGKDYRYLPFGSGRRICVGVPLVERMLPYTLASLVHSFEWRLPEGDKLDLLEKFTMFLKKATPLAAIPHPRLSNMELYS